MNNLIINGMKNIDGMQFHDIEGGFGEGKKALLVKEIANIHGRELKEINRRINDNRKRFTNNIDIVDLKGTEFEVLLKHHGIYTQNSINRSDNLYALSERGYAKLLKILEDDVAWEQYDKLVDGYFNMKSELKSGQPKLVNSDLKEKEIETKNNNSFARVLNALNKILKNPSSSIEAKKEANIKLERFLSGQDLDIKVLGRKTYSADDIGKKLGVSRQKIGRLSETHNLKTEEFGEWFKDKSKYSSKEVPSFRYYENVIPVFKGLLSSKETCKQEKLNV